MSKTTKVTVEDKLRALYDLQLIDSRIDRIADMRGELPLEVEDLEDELAGLGTRIEKMEAEITDLQTEISNKKISIKDSEALIKKYKEQQNNVRNNREFEALDKEVEFQTLEIQLSEKRIREFEVSISHKQEVLNTAIEKMNIRKDDLSHKKAELEKILSETAAEEKALRQKSEDFGKIIEERLLNAYKKIRGSQKNGLAIVAIERGASGGSFYKIPPQTQIEVGNRKKIIFSEFDGRILVDPDLAKEEEEKISQMLEALKS